MLTQFFLIGEVLKPQGIRGEAKLCWDAADPETSLAWDTLYFRDGDSYQPVSVRVHRLDGDFAYVQFSGCSTPEDVERLRGREVYIDRAHASPLPEGGYYLSDLKGCRAQDEAGKELSVLTDVLQYGPTDIYVFRTAKGELMAPALPDVFVETDVAANIIRVNTKRLSEVAVVN